MVPGDSPGELTFGWLTNTSESQSQLQWSTKAGGPYTVVMAEVVPFGQYGQASYEFLNFARAGAVPGAAASYLLPSPPLA